MPLGTVALLLAASFGLGCLPLTGWIARAIAGKDLSAIGTGNVGVSAAFIHGGKLAGIAAVLAEIARGILPVLVARICLPDVPAIAIALLIPLAAGRYAIARGGGVTNSVWGVLAFSPPVAVASGISGLLAWRLAALWWGAGRSRLFASRCGCLSTPLWVWVFRHSFAEFLAAAGLAGLLLAINLIQGDDMALSKSELLFSLDDALDAKVCGDKAARLSQLKRAGFNVLSGSIVVKEEGRRKKEEGRRKKEEGRGKKEEGRGKEEEINRNWESGRELLISEGLIHQIKSKFFSRLIVRSSAAGEDGEISSAAGQYQSIGPVFAETELAEAINRCYQSYWTAEAVAYRRQRQLAGAQMAVLIQPYIDSEIAGVMFTRNPLDGGSQVIVEAVRGGAQAVVGGQVTPVHLEIDFSDSDVLENDLVRAGDESIIRKDILAELVKIGRAIEDFFHGIPQDIEWSWDGEKLWILQSRQITNLQPIWTRTIAAEVIPGAIHSLTWSINRPLTCGVWGEIFRVVLGDRANNLNFNETATLLGSHAYFNATLLGEIFRMMGLPEQGLEFLVRGQKIGKPPLGKVLPSLPGLWRLVQRERALNEEFKVDRNSIFLPALASLDAKEEGRHYTDYDTDTRMNYPYSQGQKSEGRPKLEEGRGKREEESEASYQLPIVDSQLPVPDYQYLLGLLERAEQIQEWLKPITYYNILGPIGLAIRKAIFRVPDEWLDNDRAPEIASVRALQQLARKLRQAAISRFQETVSAAELGRVFAETPALEEEFLQWLDCYGYLSEVGTDIAVPTWREQPDVYRKLLVNLAGKQEGRKATDFVADVADGLLVGGRLAADFVVDGSVEEDLTASGKLGLSFWQQWRLDKCLERGRVKSEISEIYARLLAHLRWTFLAIEASGLELRIFEETGDIFYLEFGEIQDWIRGGADVSFRDIIKERRERLAVDRTRAIPPVVYGNLLPNTQKRAVDIATKTSVMQGIPASIGIVEGVVKICRSATVELGENAIAVVPYTDAGWAPLLLGARAIVAEVGGQLSHGAIIAREYKIPAVMNVAEATTRLQDGQKVRVDGYLGTVELLE